MTNLDTLRHLIATECPALAQDCVAGTADAFRYRRTALNFVRTYYPGCQLAFTHGSVGSGHVSAFSDIDLYLVMPCEEETKVLEIFEGLPVEARVMKPETVDELLALPPKVTRTASFVAGALEDAFLISGSQSLLDDLVQRATCWLDACPVTLGLEAITLHRIRVTNRVLDLASESMCSGRWLKAIAEIVDSVRVLSNAEKGIFQGRNMLKHLARYWPERAQAITAAIDAVTVGKDSVPLVQLAIQALDPFGGFLLDRFRM